MSKNLQKTFYIQIQDQSQDLLSLYQSLLFNSIQRPDSIYKKWMALPENNFAYVLCVDKVATKKKLDDLINQSSWPMQQQNNLKWYEVMSEDQLIRIIMYDQDIVNQIQALQANQFKDLVIFHSISTEQYSIQKINLQRNMNVQQQENNIIEGINNNVSQLGPIIPIENKQSNQDFKKENETIKIKMNKKKEKNKALKVKILLFEQEVESLQSRIQIQNFEMQDEKTTSNNLRDDIEKLKKMQLRTNEDKDFLIELQKKQLNNKQEQLQELTKKSDELEKSQIELQEKFEQERQENLKIKEENVSIIKQNNELRKFQDELQLKIEKKKQKYQRNKKDNKALSLSNKKIFDDNKSLIDQVQHMKYQLDQQYKEILDKKDYFYIKNINNQHENLTRSYKSNELFNRNHLFIQPQLLQDIEIDRQLQFDETSVTADIYDEFPQFNVQNNKKIYFMQTQQNNSLIKELNDNDHSQVYSEMISSNKTSNNIPYNNYQESMNDLCYYDSRQQQNNQQKSFSNNIFQLSESQINTIQQQKAFNQNYLQSYNEAQQNINECYTQCQQLLEKTSQNEQQTFVQDSLSSDVELDKTISDQNLPSISDLEYQKEISDIEQKKNSDKKKNKKTAINHRQLNKQQQNKKNEKKFFNKSTTNSKKVKVQFHTQKKRQEQTMNKELQKQFKIKQDLKEIYEDNQSKIKNKNNKKPTSLNENLTMRTLLQVNKNHVKKEILKQIK